jgi:uncharacterized UBP type Zn finger protein
VALVLQMPAESGGGASPTDRGFPNTDGTSCFLISAVQILLRSDGAANVPELRERPQELQAFRRRLPPQMHEGQQDMSEALAYLLGSPSFKPLLDLCAPSGTYTLTCGVCKRSWPGAFETSAPVNLSLPTQAGVPDVQTMLDTLFLEEPMGPETQCQHCPQRGQVSKRMEWMRPPDEMLLSLKRFDGLAKDTRPITVPLTLTRGGDRHYELVGMGEHQGRSIEVGHYTTVARHEGERWLRFDDNRPVTECVPETDGAFVSSTAYVLLYRSAP